MTKMRKAVPGPRQSEIAANLAAVRERIAAACRAAGRSPEEVTLIAVTKTYPASDVLHLASLGVADVGENRDTEAADKAAEVAQAGADVRWHFIGQLQRNKCRSVVRYAHMVHSVDRVSLVRELASQAGRVRTDPLDVLIQVSLDGDLHRGGALPTGADAADRDFRSVVRAVAEAGPLRLRGVMAVAPLDRPDRQAFAGLDWFTGVLRADHPDATVISAGMSDDLDEAVACGATHVRIGSALLGKRPRLL